MLAKVFLSFWLGILPFVMYDAVMIPCITQQTRIDGDDDDTGDDVP